LSSHNFSQSITIEKEINSSYYELGSLQIYLTNENILILNGSEKKFSENLRGKKVIGFSPSGNYFFTASYQFSASKQGYPVEVRVFNREGSIIFPHRFLAPFDLPHSLIATNDNGVLAIFDPISFKVELLSETETKLVELEKEIPFEMEKAVFIQMDEDFLYILTSRIALDITERENNTTLYKTNLIDLSVKKKDFPFNTPTLLKVYGGYVFVSGVWFKNLQPMGNTFKFDLELNHLALNELIVEQLIPFGKNYYAKYFDTVYQLENDLSISKEKKLSNGERIFDIGISNDKLIALSSKIGECCLYSFFPNFKIDFIEGLNKFAIKEFDNISISNNSLMIRHDSKSIKLKINDN
jgi:hypothetical protein